MEFQKKHQTVSQVYPKVVLLDKTPLCKTCFVSIWISIRSFRVPLFYTSQIFVFLRFYKPREPTTFIFRGYNPYFGGVKPSCFMVLGSKGIGCQKPTHWSFWRNFSGAKSVWNIMVVVPFHLLACLSIYLYPVYICIYRIYFSINNQVSTHHQVFVQHTLYSPVALLCVST